MDAMENLTYDELQIGDSATYTRTLTEDELVLFAAVSGDVNPVHLDPQYASQTIFQERTAHGVWSGALITAAWAATLPGSGTICLERSLGFQRPVKLEDAVRVRITVAAK